jgi:hypothetical protein
MKALFIRFTLAILLASAANTRGSAIGDQFFFHSTDSLAARDEWGLVHQSPVVNSTDFAPRYHWRPLYYMESGTELIAQPAYVGALQRDLQRLGYFCGPIDGIYSPEVSDAIARMQKNFSMRVTGTLTVAVRRALHLP